MAFKQDKIPSDNELLRIIMYLHMLFRESVMICVWKYPGRGQYDAISHENGGSSDGNVVRILWQ